MLASAIYAQTRCHTVTCSLTKPSISRGPVGVTSWAEDFWRGSLSVAAPVMSKATKRKHVTREVVEEFMEPQGNQKIVKVLCGRGNNLHQVEEAGGQQFLASMPTKFRKNVWIKRGDYVVVEPIVEGNKVQAEITHILFPRQIKYLKEIKHWPSQFEDSRDSSGDKYHQEPQQLTEAAPSGDSLNSEEEEDDLLFVNPNRPHAVDIESSSSEECASSDEED